MPKKTPKLHLDSSSIEDSLKWAIMLQTGKSVSEGFASPSMVKSMGMSEMGLPIIAIGKNGGKIVGYDAKGQPIYASSSAAKKLVASKQASGPIQKIKQWLSALGIQTKSFGVGMVELEEADAKALQDHFGTTVQKQGGKTFVQTKSLVGLIGKPIMPLDKDSLAAEVAAPDPFPEDLSTLKPTGKSLGSHGSPEYKDSKTGDLYLFKYSDKVIARAEEAVSRIGALLLPGQVHEAKYVTLNGLSGTLIKMHPGYEPIGKEASSMEVSPALMKKFQKYFDGIVQQHVLDWMCAQHDAHGENIGIVNDKIFGIDKGQAWKFLGKDALPKPGMEASSAANPNPSKQVYSQFWKAYHDGKIKGDPVKAASVVFSRLENLSEDQLKVILTPYAKAVGGSSYTKKLNTLLKRFHESKSNWENFLGESIPTSTKASLKAPTTPGKTPLPKKKEQTPKLTLVKPHEEAAPKKTSSAVGGKGAFQPVKMGKTFTLLAPGGSDHKFGDNYPGVGFQADVKYKGQAHKIEFQTSGVFVQYPDGTSGLWDTPQYAADSMVLKAKGLPVEWAKDPKKLKEKGIAYSATKMLKTKELKDVLKEYGTIEPDLTPLPPEKKLKDLLLDHGPGLVTDKSLIPTPLQEWAKAHDSEVHLFVDSGDDPAVYLAASGLDSDGGPTYYTAIVEDEFLPVVTSKKPPILEVLEVMGSELAPKAEPDGSSKVETPADASVTPGPLAAGTKITTKKKFKGFDQKQEVHLEVQPNGKFAVVLPWVQNDPGEWGAATFDASSKAAAKGSLDQIPVGTEISVGAVSPAKTSIDAVKLSDDLWQVDFNLNTNNLSATDLATLINSFANKQEGGTTEVAFKSKVPGPHDGIQWWIDNAKSNTMVVGATEDHSEGYTFNFATSELTHTKNGDTASKVVALSVAKDAFDKLDPTKTIVNTPDTVEGAVAAPKTEEDLQNIPIGASYTLKLKEKAGDVEALKITKAEDGLFETDWSNASGLPTGTPSKLTLESVAAILHLFEDEPLEDPYNKKPKPPQASEVVTQMPAAMEPVDAVQTVAQKLTLLEAFDHLDFVKQHPGVFQVKPSKNATGVYNITVKKGQGYSNEEGVELLQNLIAQHGITPGWPSHPKSNGYGAFCSIKEDEAQKLHEVQLEAQDANPVAVKNNFETMPDVEVLVSEKEPGSKAAPVVLPKKLKTIAKSLTKKAKLEKLEALPKGAQVAFGDGTVLQKDGLDWTILLENKYGPFVYGLVGQKVHAVVLANKIKEWGGVKCLPGDAKLEDTLPAPPPPAKTPKPPKKPKDPELEAKKAWAKEWKAATADVQKRLAHLAEIAGVPGAEWYMRSGSGGVLFGDGTQATVDAVLKQFPHVQTEQTPFGPLVKMSESALEAATPSADTIKGPDGATYPVGTTFEEKKTNFKSTWQMLELEGGKIRDYKGDNPAIGAVYKWQKTEDAKEKLLEIQKKYGWEGQPFIEGSANWLFEIPVSKAELQKVSDKWFDLEVEAKKPTPPPDLKSKALGLSGTEEVGEYGDPAFVNTGDIEALDSITPPKLGHFIRMGAANAFLGGGVKVFKYKRADGVIVSRIVAEVCTELEKGKMGWTPDYEPPFYMSKMPPKKGNYQAWGTYDEETGAWEHGPHKSWNASAEGCKSKELSGGAKAYTWGSSVTTLARHVAIDVPEGGDAVQAMTDALTSLGLDPETHLQEPEPEDEAIQIKMALVMSSYKNKGRIQIAKMQKSAKTKAAFEKKLDTRLETVGWTHKVAQSELITGSTGTIQVVTSDLDDKLGLGKDYEYLVHSGSDALGAANILVQGGILNQADRYMSGHTAKLAVWGSTENATSEASTGTTSGEQDMHSGGAFGVFTRFKKKGASLNTWSGAFDCIIHPRVLRQNNWMAFIGDKYGSQTVGGSETKSRDTLGELGSHNEITLQSVDPKDICGFNFKAEINRKDFIKACKDAGVTEHQGVAIEDICFVGGAASAAQKMALLKKGIHE